MTDSTFSNFICWPSEGVCSEISWRNSCLPYSCVSKFKWGG